MFGSYRDGSLAHDVLQLRRGSWVRQQSSAPGFGVKHYAAARNAFRCLLPSAFLAPMTLKNH